MLLAPAIVAVSGLALAPMLTSGMPAQFAACVVFGVGYGSYMLVLRDVLSDFARRRRSTHYIAWFNNVPNYGAILGFGLMAGIAVVCRLGGYSFAAVVALFVTVFAAVQVMLALVFLSSSDLSASDVSASGRPAGDLSGSAGRPDAEAGIIVSDDAIPGIVPPC